MKIVIKVGTSTLTYATGLLNIRHMERLCRTLADIKNAGHELILVTSGAVAMGRGKLGIKERPSDIPTKQACAAVGQCALMDTYDQLLGAYHHVAAQILLTAGDIGEPERRGNFQNTVSRLLALGSLPIINENDTVATEEMSLGDNDALAAAVAACLDADLLILLSDIDGLYTADPRKDPDARLISSVPVITEELEKAAGGSVSGLGTGGMESKLHAAKTVLAKGIPMVIANGSDPEVLYDIIEGKPVGTTFGTRKDVSHDDR